MIPNRNPSKEDRLRIKLHKQQNGLCAYSGKGLQITHALSDLTEIDHILPFSRTLDDTAANKVLVLREFNRIKGNLSPYEAKEQFQKAGVIYEELLTRTSILPGSKKWRFLENAMKQFDEEKQSGDQGWLARQLNDTSYMARVARDYLRYITGNVDTYPGGMTAKLRKAWGFNSLINQDNNNEKNRDDHRHHAIDALVIACANRSMLNAISKASGKGEKIDEDWTKGLIKDAPPYTIFSREKLQELVDKIIISHKPDHGSPGKNGSTSGGLHKDTFYGKTKDQSKLNNGQIRLVIRMDIKDIEEKYLPNIADKLLRNKFIKAVNERQEGLSAKEIIVQCANENKIHSLRMNFVENERSFVAIKDKAHRPYKWVVKGSNHHVDIFCPIKDKKELKTKTGQWSSEVVSTFDANQKGFAPKWKKEHPTAKLIMRLHINDMVAYDEGSKVKNCRVQKISNKASGIYVFLKEHNNAATEDGWGASASNLQKKNARKISVTPSGKIYDPGKASMPKPLRNKVDTAA